jgi:hypothetical protein
MKNIKTFTVGEDKVEVLFFKEMEDGMYKINMVAYFEGFSGGVSPCFESKEKRDQTFNEFDDEKAYLLVKSVANMTEVDFK